MNEIKMLFIIDDDVSFSRLLEIILRSTNSMYMIYEIRSGSNYPHRAFDTYTNRLLDYLACCYLSLVNKSSFKRYLMQIL